MNDKATLQGMIQNEVAQWSNEGLEVEHLDGSNGYGVLITREGQPVAVAMVTRVIHDGYEREAIFVGVPAPKAVVKFVQAAHKVLKYEDLMQPGPNNTQEMDAWRIHPRLTHYKMALTKFAGTMAAANDN